MLINVNLLIEAYATEKSYNIVKKIKFKIGCYIKTDGINC